ncbi:hypothetical protein [Streptomyces sp. HB132]
MRHRLPLALRPGRSPQSLSAHLAVIEAIGAGEPQPAETAVRSTGRA